MMPESLSELWCSKRVPAEALPSLLKEMEPTLKPSDYAQAIPKKNLVPFLWIAWIFAALFCTMPFHIRGFDVERKGPAHDLTRSINPFGVRFA
jgi:hypothetical protein